MTAGTSRPPPMAVSCVEVAVSNALHACAGAYFGARSCCPPCLTTFTTDLTKSTGCTTSWPRSVMPPATSRLVAASRRMR